MMVMVEVVDRVVAVDAEVAISATKLVLLEARKLGH